MEYDYTSLGMEDPYAYRSEDHLSDPTWLGTYYPWAPSFGRFEMKITGSVDLGDGLESITGVIKDEIGDSVFSGWKSKDEIRFTKFYDEAAIQNGAAAVVSYYSTHVVDGQIVGNYTVHDSFDPFTGPGSREEQFWMWEPRVIEEQKKIN